MLSAIQKFLLQPRTILWFYVLIAIVASVQLVMVGPHVFAGKTYTDYNNYIIFKQSFFHLLSGKNLYILYPDEQWDLYKYSPTFALAMGLFSHLPDMVGLSIWNLVNALALLAAIRLLPFKQRTLTLLLWFVLLELLTSLQNAQSNGLMAALLLAAYGHLQKGKPQWATLWLVIATFIKVYGAIGFCLFLFYPGKLKFIAYAALWTVVVAAIPLVVTPLHTLVGQYRNWAVMMAEDQSTSYGLSVMGWLHSWFGVNNGKSLVSIIGLVLFLIPFVRWKMYQNEVYKLLILSAMLVWVIIFNHKAESPTFIIAVAGIGIWYFVRPRLLWRDVLLGFVFIFTCLSPTDFFPPFIKERFLIPCAIKAIPCILAWCIIFVDIMLLKTEAVLSPTSNAL